MKAQLATEHYTQFVALDTILFLDDIGVDALNGKVRTKSIDDVYYISYYDNALHKDTFFLTQINLITKVLNKQYYVIQGLKYATLDERQRITDFDINNKDLVILVGNKLFHLSRETNLLVKVELNEYSEYRQIKLLNNKLFLAKAYDYFNPFREVVKSEISLMNLLTHKIEKSIQPRITGIELTHFPVKPISFFHDKIIVSQNFDYSFSIYDSNLNIIQEVKDYKPLANKIDSNKLKKKSINQLFKYVGEHFFTAGTLQKCKAIDSNRFIVIYNDGKESYDEYNLIDVWQKDNTTGNFVFTGKTFLANYNHHYNLLNKDSSFILTKENYFEHLMVGEPQWHNNRFINLSSNTKIYPFGYTLRQFFFKKQDYFKKEKPIINVSIFKVVQ